MAAEVEWNIPEVVFNTARRSSSSIASKKLRGNHILPWQPFINQSINKHPVYY